MVFGEPKDSKSPPFGGVVWGSVIESFHVCLAVLLGASLIGGCLLERGGRAGPDAGPVMDAGSVDAGSVDAAMLDGGRPVDSGADAGPPCGNAALEADEECDGPLLRGQTCTSQGLTGGPLACSSECTYDLSTCEGCGNGVIEVGESCDGADLAGLSCAGAGLRCTDACTLDPSACTLPSLGDGSDGPLRVSARYSLHDLESPSYGVDSLGTATASLTLDPTLLSAGDEVVLINMGGSEGDCGVVGTHEFLVVDDIQGQTLFFTSRIMGHYGAGGGNSSLNGQAVMIQRVPHFTMVEVEDGGVLTTAAWNGARGGLMIFRAQTVGVRSGGLITTSGLGYRGGAAWSGTEERGGRQGESTCDDARAVSTLPSVDGGGGGGIYQDPGDGCGQGGGGGGHSTEGQWVGFSSSCVDAGNDNPAQNGGGIYGTPELTQWLMGSGGGSGASDDHSGDSGRGGRGGGTVVLYVGRLEVNGRLVSHGGSGGVPDDIYDSGNGGGGAGGSLMLSAQNFSGSGRIGSLGGNGPDSESVWNSGGGDGGQGRIRLDYQVAYGENFGSDAAQTAIESHVAPIPGATNLYLQ